MRKSPVYSEEDDRKILEGFKRGFSAVETIRHYFKGKRFTKNAVLSRLRKLRGPEVLSKESKARKLARADARALVAERANQQRSYKRRQMKGDPVRRKAEQLLKAERERQARVENLKHPPPLGGVNDIPDANTCRYVHGTPGAGDWRMCGHDILTGTRYCTFHAALCGVKPPKSQRNVIPFYRPRTAAS